MQINSSINKRNLEEMTIKSLVWNSVLETFLIEKNMDIKPYLVSIQLKWKTIIVKVNKPIVKSEILLLEDMIIKEVENKFKKVWIKFYDFDIKYIV